MVQGKSKKREMRETIMMSSFCWQLCAQLSEDVRVDDEMNKKRWKRSYMRLIYPSRNIHTRAEAEPRAHAKITRVYTRSRTMVFCSQME
jgi:hypothetical protein